MSIAQLPRTPKHLTDARPYRDLSRAQLVELIDQTIVDMDASGRAGDKGAYIKASDAFVELRAEWTRRYVRVWERQ